MGELSLSLRSLVPSPTDKVAGDSSGNAGLETHTLESEVSPFLPKQFTYDAVSNQA